MTDNEIGALVTGAHRSAVQAGRLRKWLNTLVSEIGGTSYGRSTETLLAEYPGVDCDSLPSAVSLNELRKSILRVTAKADYLSALSHDFESKKDEALKAFSKEDMDVQP